QYAGRGGIDMPDEVTSTDSNRLPSWSLLALVREVFEDDPGPDLIDAVYRLHPRHLDRFLALYAERRETQSTYLHLPPNRGGELRPYLGARFSRGWTGRDVILQSFNDWSERGSAFQFIDRLKQHLLYCHSIALRNPLGQEAVYWRSVLSRGVGGFPWDY